MGRPSSSVAIRGLDRAEIARRLGREDTGRAFSGGRNEAGLGDAGNGWLIVIFRRLRDVSSEGLIKLSKGAEVLHCEWHDVVMVSHAREFRDGHQIWSIFHDPQKGLYNLAIDGEPPPEFGPIHEKLRAEQDAEGGEEAGVDCLFELPIQLVDALTFGAAGSAEGIAFTELAPIRRGLFRGLFGGRSS